MIRIQEKCGHASVATGKLRGKMQG